MSDQDESYIENGVTYVDSRSKAEVIRDLRATRARVARLADELVTAYARQDELLSELQELATVLDTWFLVRDEAGTPQPFPLGARLRELLAKWDPA